MTPFQKQAELNKYLAITQATLIYLLDNIGGIIVYNQFDPMNLYYQEQKIQIDKYYQQRRLDRLQQ
jgi:hypothetical protein